MAAAASRTSTGPRGLAGPRQSTTDRLKADVQHPTRRVLMMEHVYDAEGLPREDVLMEVSRI